MTNKRNRKKLTPMKAIRIHCLICNGGPKGVKECQSTDCVFHNYRMGSNPARKGIGGRPSHQRHSKPLLKLAKRGEFETNGQGEGKDVALGISALKSANNKEIISVGKGSIKIEKIGKNLIIKLTQE